MSLSSKPFFCVSKSFFFVNNLFLTESKHFLYVSKTLFIYENFFINSVSFLYSRRQLWAIAILFVISLLKVDNNGCNHVHYQK